MKRRFIILAIGILLLGSACTKKSTEPEEKPTEEYSLEATQTIGSEGGTIEADDFSLVVPDGAFSSNFELKLYASSEDKPFGDNGASRTFRLEGLPDEYAQPLRVRIKYEGTLSNQSYVALGRGVSDPIADTAVISYDLLSATDSSGYLLCELPARQAVGSHKPGYDGVKRGWASPFDNFLVAITDYVPYISSEKRFYIYSPASVAGTVDELAGYLEAAYNTFEQMGFSYNGPDDRYPKVDSVRVTVRDMGERRTSGWLSPVSGAVNKVNGSMDVNSNIMSQSNLPGMRIEVGSAVFDIVLELYRPGLISGFDSFWLHHASKNWVEGKFTEETNYVPSDFAGQEMDPFTGIGTLIQIQGMAALIKYWADHYGDNVLVKILGAWTDWRVHSIDAVLDNIDDPEYVWWPDFFYEYISGNIYGVRGGLFSGNAAGKFDINSATDTLKVFTGSYRDLSAKLYLINLNYADIDSSALLKFAVSGTNMNLDYVTVMLFSLKDGSLQYVDDSTPDLTVENVKALTQGGYDLVAVVINSLNESPYNGSRDIDLKVEVVVRPEWQHKYVNINLDDFVGYWQSSDAAKDTNKAEFSHHRGAGTLIGNEFAGWWDTTYWSGSVVKHRHAGNLTIYIDTESLDVLSFSAVDTTVYWYYHEADRYDSSITVSSVSGGDIPLVYQDEWYLKCWVTGTDACSHITSFRHKMQERNSYGDEYWRELSSFQCNEDSRIRIEFRSAEW